MDNGWHFVWYLWKNGQGLLFGLRRIRYGVSIVCVLLSMGVTCILMDAPSLRECSGRLTRRREGTTHMLDISSREHFPASRTLGCLSSPSFTPSQLVTISAATTHRASTCHWQPITPRPILLLRPHSLRPRAQSSTLRLPLEPIRAVLRAPRQVLSRKLRPKPVRVPATSKVRSVRRAPLSRMMLPLKSRVGPSWLRRSARSARRPALACPRAVELVSKVRTVHPSTSRTGTLTRGFYQNSMPTHP